VIEQINSFAENNTLFMMYLCFLIGIIHLSIAHVLNAVKMINSLKVLAEVGWIALLWTLFFVAGNLVLAKPFPFFTPYLFILGLLLTLVFSNFQKNVFKGIGTTMGDLPLSIISSFSDIVSYLRLFAVGYASVTVAASFNGMALEGGIHSILSGIIAALILFLGHSLNIVLGILAVVVHGIRLNMLEFSGQLNMQWSGRNYQPFKE
jgi:V/A-type H+-transporting ATPase subunit I